VSNRRPWFHNNDSRTLNLISFGWHRMMKHDIYLYSEQPSPPYHRSLFNLHNVWRQMTIRLSTGSFRSYHLSHHLSADICWPIDRPEMMIRMWSAIDDQSSWVGSRPAMFMLSTWFVAIAKVKLAVAVSTERNWFTLLIFGEPWLPGAPGHPFLRTNHPAPKNQLPAEFYPDPDRFGCDAKIICRHIHFYKYRRRCLRWLKM
jgi:hypothetical protein